MNSDEWQDVSREQLWKALDDDGKAFVRELADVFGNITFVHGRVKHETGGRTATDKTDSI